MLRGLRNFRGRCVHCGSEHVRPSRESYTGALAPALRLTPFRCRDCKRHFAVPPYARRLETRKPERRCPRCGGSGGVSSTEPTPRIQQFFGREQVRCLDCHRRFVFTHVRRAVANVVLAAAILAGLSLAIGELSGIGRWLGQQGKQPPAERARKR